jgi:AAA domain/DnaB-like helicase N terminal domain
LLSPEEAVIGACILDQGVIREAVKLVMPSDFSTWQGEEIFSSIIALHSTGQPVDLLTVADRLAESGSRVNPVDLHRVVAEVPTAANVGYYAEQVRESATRRRLTAAGQKLVQYSADPAHEPGIVLQEALQELKAARDDSPVSSLSGKHLGDIMAEPDHFDWVIKNLLERGDRWMMTADEGGGKSMLTFQIAIFASAGIHPFWLHEIPPVDVVVYDRENSENRWRRKARPIFEAAQAIGKGKPADVYVENDIYGSFDITKDRDLGKIHHILDMNPCDLLILGPLYTLVPRAITTDDDAAPVIQALNSLRERGVCLIMEAHAGHSRGSDLHPIGSSAWLRWPEFGIGLRKDPEVVGRMKFERWRGDREERSFPLAMNRGKIGSVPWVAEGVSPALLAQLNDPNAMFHPDNEGQTQHGF